MSNTKKKITATEPLDISFLFSNILYQSTKIDHWLVDLMNRCQSMKGQCNFSILVPSHGFENNEALIDGRCKLVVASALVGGGGPVTVIGRDVLIFILGN